VNHGVGQQHELHARVVRQLSKVDYTAEMSTGYASGTFDPVPIDVSFDGCI
jgi:hypothetical protein